MTSVPRWESKPKSTSAHSWECEILTLRMAGMAGYPTTFTESILDYSEYSICFLGFREKIWQGTVHDTSSINQPLVCPLQGSSIAVQVDHRHFDPTKKSQRSNEMVLFFVARVAPSGAFSGCSPSSFPVLPDQQCLPRSQDSCATPSSTYPAARCP